MRAPRLLRAYGSSLALSLSSLILIAASANNLWAQSLQVEAEDLAKVKKWQKTSQLQKEQAKVLKELARLKKATGDRTELRKLFKEVDALAKQGNGAKVNGELVKLLNKMTQGKNQDVWRGQNNNDTQLKQKVNDLIGQVRKELMQNGQGKTNGKVVDKVKTLKEGLKALFEKEVRLTKGEMDRLNNRAVNQWLMNEGSGKQVDLYKIQKLAEEKREKLENLAEKLKMVNEWQGNGGVLEELQNDARLQEQLQKLEDKKKELEMKEKGGWAYGKDAVAVGSGALAFPS